MGYGVVALGPGGSYLFSTPTRWSRYGLPPEVNDLFSHGPHLLEVYECALGPDGSYLVAYKTASAHENLPQGLKKWLMPVEGGGIERDMDGLNVTLGPNRSYFAFDKNGSSWDNLSDEFEQVLVDRRQPWGAFKYGKGPRNVSLGPNGSFVFVDTSGMAHWSDSLRYEAPSLNQILLSSSAAVNLDQFYILNANIPGTWVIIAVKGPCNACLPPNMLPDFDCFAKDWRHACDIPVAQQTRSTGFPLIPGSSPIASRPSFPMHGLFDSNNPFLQQQQSNPYDLINQYSSLNQSTSPFTQPQVPSMNTINNGVNMLGMGMSLLGMPSPFFS